RLVIDALRDREWERIEGMDPDLIEEAGECGLRPLAILLGAARAAGLSSKVLSYEGPFGVGYPVVAFTSAAGGFDIQDLGRRAIETYLRSRQLIDPPQPIPAALQEPSALFVTLRKGRELRGCVGSLRPTEPTAAHELIRYAVAAAVRDPRFEPVRLDELRHLSIKVQLLEPAEPVTAILDAIAVCGLGLTPEPAPAVSDAVLHRVHDPRYVAMLDRAAASGGGYLDADTYITPDSMVAARTAAGAVVEGVDRVLDGRAQHAVAVVRPPGHHAEHARAMGFCLLNNVAIGVAAARGKNIRRVAVLDFDVHHGNGTQHSFENDAEVFYASTHRYPFYPGTGSAGERGAHDNVVNVPLPAGSGDRAVLGAWEKKIGPALAAFRAEFIMVSAGFDAHRDDPLGGLAVTTEGYRT